MARTDSTRRPGDSWDLASSVGSTATMVAAARALASAAPDAIIDDPFAAPLVRAVGIDFFTRLVDGQIVPPDAGPPADGDQTGDQAGDQAGEPVGDQAGELRRMTASLAVRTKFFDDFFLEACAGTATGAGIRQAVILASGLDARPYRLAWPADGTVYEVDQPRVIDFKSATMAALGAEPTARRRTVAVDLREDWPAALRTGGFDDAAPSAWSAEGLLLYLPPAAQDRLFDHITALSAPGSRLATEYHPDAADGLTERARSLSDQWRAYGYDMDMTELFYGGERNNVVDYLTERGWDVETRRRRELFAEYGLEFPEDDASAPFRNVVAVTAVRR